MTVVKILLLSENVIFCGIKTIVDFGKTVINKTRIESQINVSF